MSEDQCLVSVIIPVYNVRDFLEPCVESVLNQTYENLEVILVDDGSTDGSGELCDVYAKRDTRIVVVHKENGGLSDARNAGLDLAKGGYFAFLDSDDCFSSNAMETMVRDVQATSCDIAVCNMVRLYWDGSVEPFYCPTTERVAYMGPRRYETLVQPSVCNKLFRAELFDGVRFPKGKLYEDTYVYHILLHRANGVVMTGEKSYWYRSRAESIMEQPRYTEKYFDFVEAVWKRATFLTEHDVHPYAQQACLSLYAAYSNAEKYVKRTAENQELFRCAKTWYLWAYRSLKSSSHGMSLKQRIRLFLLAYAPRLHSALYHRGKP